MTIFYLAAAGSWNPDSISMADIAPSGEKFGKDAYQSFRSREKALEWAGKNGMFPVSEKNYMGMTAISVAPITHGGIKPPYRTESRHNRASVWHVYISCEHLEGT